MKNGKRLGAYLALLGNTFLWALAIPLAKRGFQDGLSPISFLFNRFLLAAVLSVPLIIFLKDRVDVRRVWRAPLLGKIILLELLGTFVALWLLYEGVLRTTVVEATLISITWPVFVTIGGVLFFGEKENRHELLGLFLAILGSLVVVAIPLLTNGFHWRSLLGNLMILGQNLAIAAYYLLAKRTYRGLNKWAVTHVSFWIGAAAFALVILGRGSTPGLETTFLLTNSSPWPLIATLYMAVFGSILALTLYLIGQDKIEASEASIFTYLQPVFTIPIAVFFLGESVSLFGLAGAGLILFGVFWAQIHHKSS